MAQKESVFVVDDDAHVLMSVEALLVGNGYKTECFSNGADFLEKTDLDQVGCVVSDLQMPEMHGTELQKHLLSRNSPLALIVVTGFADVPSTVKIMEKGAITLLEKPYDAQSLIAAVERAFTQSRETRQQQLLYTDAVERLSQVDEEEMQVMECAIKGMPVKAISDFLTMSNRTVDRRRQTALAKARASSISEFAMLLARYRPNNS